MSTFIYADTDPTQPSASIPYLEKDGVILRGVTKSMFDFSHPETYGAAGSMPIGTVFNNLVVGGGAGGVTGAGGTTFPPIFHGTVRTLGLVTGANGSNITLPDTFKLPSGTTRFLSILWLRMVKTGWPVVAQVNKAIAGWGTGVPSATQYAVTAVFDATGTISAFRWTVYGSNSGVIQTSQLEITSTTILNKILDGALHQIGCAYDIVSGTGTPSLYVDGELVATGTGTVITGLNMAGAAGQLFGLASAGSVTQPGYHELDTRIGRPQIHDLSSRNDISFVSVLTQDKNSAAGYLS